LLSLPPSVRLFVATQPIDGRKGADSLMVLVRDVLHHDPLLCVATRYVAWPVDRVSFA
jgi:transposase